jgi:hypothetical protein
MISFKKYLEEKAMNAKVYAQTEIRMAKIAKVGFEFECFVPEKSPMYVGGSDKDDRDTMPLRRIDSIDEIFEYFEVSRREQKSLQNEYDDWVDGVRDAWVEDNLDQDLVDSDGETYATKDAEEQFEKFQQRTISFSEYIDNQFGGVYKYISKRDLEPKFGWSYTRSDDSGEIYIEETTSDQDQDTQSGTFKKIEYDLSKTLGATVTTAHLGAKAHYEAGEWIIVPDASIMGYNGIGAEINSPPEHLQKALHSLDTMFKWMSRNDIQTNNSTGLHINVSLPNMENVDLVKLVLFLGEKHVLKSFNRLSNAYTAAQSSSIINKLTSTGKLPREASAMIEIAKGALSKAKYSSVHIQKLSQGYLEFRIAGNEDYHKDFNKIRETVLRFVSCLEIAVDPQAERSEYLKKLSKILDTAESAGGTEFKDKSIATLIDKYFEVKVHDYFGELMAAVKAGDVKSGSLKRGRDDWVRDEFIPELGNVLRSLDIQTLTLKQVSEIKIMLNRLEVSKDVVSKAPGRNSQWLLKEIGFTN